MARLKNSTGSRAPPPSRGGKRSSGARPKPAGRAEVSDPWNLPREVEVFDGVYVTDELCLHAPALGLAAIADLHIGYEAVLHEEGVAVPHLQVRIMEKRLRRILRRFKPKRLVVAGDLKHEFSRNMRQEWEEVGRFVELLAGRAELSVVRGNHDNFLAAILSRHGLALESQLDAEGIRFFHGHRRVGAGGRIAALAHEHPSVRLRDDVGSALKLPCFLVFPEARVVVLPAFSPLASGTEVYPDRDRFLSPCLNDLGEARMDVYAVSEAGLLPFKGL